MISSIKHQFNKIIWQSDLLSVRFAIALGSLFWAILLLWPGELFVPLRTTYRLMSQIAPEHMWGIAFLIHSACAFATLFFHKTRLLFLGDAVWGVVLWTAATIACFASHWQLNVIYSPPAAMSAEISLMLASWWWLIRWIVWTETKKGYK